MFSAMVRNNGSGTCLAVPVFGNSIHTMLGSMSSTGISAPDLMVIPTVPKGKFIDGTFYLQMDIIRNKFFRKLCHPGISLQNKAGL